MRRRRRAAWRRVRSAAAEAKAFADPTRLMLAVVLAEVDELCVNDLSWVMERAEALVSHHLGALRAAGLVESRRDGKMILYALTPRGRELVSSGLPVEEAVAC